MYGKFPSFLFFTGRSLQTVLLNPTFFFEACTAFLNKQSAFPHVLSHLGSISSHFESPQKRLEIQPVKLLAAFGHMYAFWTYLIFFLIFLHTWAKCIDDRIAEYFSVINFFCKDIGSAAVSAFFLNQVKHAAPVDHPFVCDPYSSHKETGSSIAVMAAEHRLDFVSFWNSYLWSILLLKVR